MIALRFPRRFRPAEQTRGAQVRDTILAARGAPVAKLLAMRRVIAHLLLASLVTACSESEPDENPVVQSAAASQAECAANERLVIDVCTELGPDDGCVDVDDVCIALCDQAATCTTTGGLRPLNGFPTAPSGYCVECEVP